MSASLQRLLPLFERERVRHQPLVLATVVRTAGSTYTKPGAYMLIAGNGEYAGLLSGGCLEGDLAEHGRAVLATGVAKLVRYDTWAQTTCCSDSDRAAKGPWIYCCSAWIAQTTGNP